MFCDSSSSSSSSLQQHRQDSYGHHRAPHRHHKEQQPAAAAAVVLIDITARPAWFGRRHLYQRVIVSHRVPREAALALRRLKMSLWNDFMGGLKNRLLEFYVGDREQTYVRWGSVEGKFQLLFELLRALKSRKECRDVCATLTELMPVLEKQKFHYESDNIFFNRVRSSMLDLWYLLLKCVQQWSSATLAPAPPKVRVSVCDQSTRQYSCVRGSYRLVKDSAILDQAATVAASAAATPLSTSPSDVLPQANKPIQSPLNLNDAVTFYHAIRYVTRPHPARSLSLSLSLSLGRWWRCLLTD